MPKNPQSSIYNSAFTLIELSIVLVIIGLIAGGVLVGRDLIRAAEIRSIFTQKEQFESAIYTFRNKYNCIPGDCDNATAFWGAAADCTVAQTTSNICNGNGNGFVEQNNPSTTLGSEIFQFWKHLYNANLIKGNSSGAYIGIRDGINSSAATARNSPSGRISGSLWYIANWQIRTVDNWAFNNNYGQNFELGLPTIDYDPATAFIKPKEAFSLDSKYDDGKPGTGKIIARLLVIVPPLYVNNCTVKADGVTEAVNTDTNTALYKTSQDGNQCILIFPNVF